MVCKKCGNKINNDSRFCSECGTEIENLSENKDNNNTNFCSSCGITLDNEAAFCPECGNSITKKTIPINKAYKKPKKSTIVIAIVVLFIIGIYSYIKSNTSPESTAELFCSSIKEGNMDKLYKSLYLPKSIFLTKSKFKEIEDEDSNISSCEAKQIKTDKKDVKVFAITLKNSDNDKQEFEITLKKRDSKKFLLFDSWGVYNESMIVKNWTIFVPKGSTLYIEDNKIEATNNPSDDYDEYIIDNLFETEYKIKVTHPLGIEKIEEEFPSSYSTTIDLEVREDLTDDVGNFINELYKVSLLNSDDTKLIDLIDEEYVDDIEQLIESIRDQVDYSTSYYYNVEEYKNIVINEVTINDSKIISENEIKLELDYELEYDCLLEGNNDFNSRARNFSLTLGFKIKDNKLLMFRNY